ncbi:MAG: glutathione S-transferase family protein [Methylobacteriaceae bacterium]|nr:glutathione S-transferase family protein [Methylobacteriaceae bacterium]
MGLLVDGKWHDRWYDTAATGGRFVRTQSAFRNWVTPDGSLGPTGRAGFRAEPGRYHLYVSYACPWAHRTLVFRKLKGLEALIDVSVVHWLMAEEGWTFAPDPEGIVGDRANGASRLYEIYLKADPLYSGRVTVPVLWDRLEKTIVNNESAEIIRMFNSAFDGVGAAPGDYCPSDLLSEIDALNACIYDTVNNGVYKAGFAGTQSAYEDAVVPLFETLDWLDERLSRRRYLLSDAATEADWRLFPTLMRFDSIYYGHFKCNRRRLVDYPALWPYTRDLYQHPGVGETVNLAHAKAHYYQSHRTLNPSGIVPIGPDIDFEAPSGRMP